LAREIIANLVLSEKWARRCTATDSFMINVDVSRTLLVLKTVAGALKACQTAVSDYRAQMGIEAPIVEIDWTGVWWQKPDEG
jgi:hypothetical protein